MDTRKLTDIFRGTIDPSQRAQAETQLEQMKKIIGFAPSLLQLIMVSDVDMPIRQAGAIYLKNLVTQHWTDKDTVETPGFPLHFTLHEQDRSMIRDSIVDALVHAPELIQACQITSMKIRDTVKWNPTGDAFFASSPGYILPGTVVNSDLWKAYSTIGDIGCIHLTVNHSINFVDPVTFAQTQRIEN